jgi:hypothetical protein
MNLSAVGGLPCRPITAVWYRAVEPQHLPEVLGYSHARRFASRFFEGPHAATPFDILYLAENPLVALFEVGALYGSLLIPGNVVANPAQSWLTINTHVQLTRVADLTDVSGSQIPLSTTAQELTGDWLGYQLRSTSTSVSAPKGIAPTQELGAEIYRSGVFEGFLTVSAKVPYQTVLGVFPERIANGNFVRHSYTDSSGRLRVIQIP